MNLVTRRGETYEYLDTESGKRLFSVTQIRKVAHDSYAGIPEQALEAARLRGNLLHTRFWKMLASREGLCVPPPIIPHLAGYCTAMDAWAEKNAVRAVLLEEKSLNIKLGYAGTTDAQVLYGAKQIVTLMDLKSGEPTLTDPLQLLAYDQMQGLKSQKLLDLYIRADSTYTEKWITAKEKATDWPWFLSALNVLKGRVNHGIRG